MDASSNDFQGTFHPTVYLNKCYSVDPDDRPLSRFALENVHKFFESYKCFQQVEPLKVLDYGCGPVIANVISAAGLHSEIVLAEFTDSSREVIQQWLTNPRTGWDWSRYFKYVVHTLEGKSNEEILERMERIRKSIKAVVACDITQDPPIAKEFEGPYDVVMSILCIENGCFTREEYKAALKRISNLIKTGGILLLYSTVRNKEGLRYYHVGVAKYVQVALPLQFVLCTLEEVGFTDITKSVFSDMNTITTHYGRQSDLETTVFITATKL